MDFNSRDAVAARLREARSAKFSSAAEAARALGMKEVTVRAHENGRNGLSARVARVYARAYGTTPELILYGKESANSTDWAVREFEDAISHRPKPIPVIGKISPGIFVRRIDLKSDEPSSFLRFYVPGYARFDLFAFQYEGDGPYYRDGEYIIFGRPKDVGLREGDYVIWEKHDQDFVTYGTSQFEDALTNRLFVSSEPEKSNDFSVLFGVIVASAMLRERSGGPVQLYP